MKIMLIIPPSTLWSIERPHVVQPLGIGYIAAVLEKEDYDIHVLDTVALGWQEYLKKWQGKNVEKGKTIHFGLSWEEIERRVREAKPDVVGISSAYTCQSENMHKTAEVVKRVSKHIPVVVGGAHPTAFPEMVLKDKNVDIAVIGEGELTAVELMQKLDSGTDYSKVKGIAFMDGDKVKINEKREFIEDLDSIPLPARHLLPMKEYFEAKSTHGGEAKWSPVTSMITSRGCPGMCIFCSIHSIWGRKWRARSAKSVVDEIEHLVKTYNIRELHFEDDNLTLNKQRMIEICDGMIERGLSKRIRWTTPNSVMLSTLDEEVLIKMKQSGCYALSFGIESGDEHILRDVVRKNVPFDKLREVIKICKKLKIETAGSFILGLPGETHETFKKTIDFAKDIGLDRASFLAATPFPGTDLYKLCMEKGYIPKDLDWSSLRTIGSAVITTEQFTKEDVLEWQRLAYRQFYFRPKIIFNTVLSHMKSPFSIWRLVKRYSKFVEK
ncbi:MAG: radical SAM protein [Candidatus Aenigmatarchaeota archaeon]